MKGNVRRCLLACNGLLLAAATAGIPPSPTMHEVTEQPPRFRPTVENSQAAPERAPAGMVWIPGGEFSMGANSPVHQEGSPAAEATADARPIHRIYVDGFWMDRTEVTNAEFAMFVNATGYLTVAERVPQPEDFPGVPPEKLKPGSIVFSAPSHASLSDSLQWWTYVPGANWRHPLGPTTDFAGRPHHPVVHVAYEDAAAYATWAHKRLPMEAEWEFAARGGLTGKLYPWGDRLANASQWMANTHQGHFPNDDTAADGFAGIAPVGQFPENRYGLSDMSGNVWEWTSDWYRVDYYVQLNTAARSVTRNPRGPTSSFDPLEPGVRKRVQRGGSFLCTHEYCLRYLVGARGKGEVSTGTNHLGFRCVQEPERR